MFILRNGRSKPVEYNLTDELSVRYPTIHRPTGKMIGGLFQEVESAGIEAVAQEEDERQSLLAVGERWEDVKSYLEQE